MSAEAQDISKRDGMQYTPVNKGHFELDTSDRINLFHEKLGSGWTEEYKKYRSLWKSLPEQKIVRDYPILVDVELASSCNLKCPMCYTTTDHFKETVKRKLMDWSIYEKVIDEIAGKVFALRLSWRGESTLHPRFVEAVKLAKDKGIKEVSFLTNGSKLTLDYFKQLVDAGADWITVSFDGLEEEYDKIRAPLKYKETLKKLKDAMDNKAEHKLQKPVIKVQGVWPAIRKSPDLFYQTMKNVSDLVAFNPLIDYLDKDSDIVYEDNFSCPQLYERLFVSSTGDVMMCNSDEYGEEILGNVNNSSIHEIWHGKKLNSIRELHSTQDGFKCLNVCRNCFYPRKTVVDETALVDGRMINIENYINRSQSIGT